MEATAKAVLNPRVHPWPRSQTSRTDITPKKTSDLATDGHGYTRMRLAGFLALHREKIGTKLYGYVLAKRYTRKELSMPMKNPPHPGHSIKDACLNPLSLSVTEAAKVLGIAPVARHQRPSRDIA